MIDDDRIDAFYIRRFPCKNVLVFLEESDEAAHEWISMRGCNLHSRRRILELNIDSLFDKVQVIHGTLPICNRSQFPCQLDELHPTFFGA